MAVALLKVIAKNGEKDIGTYLNVQCSDVYKAKDQIVVNERFTGDGGVNQRFTGEEDIRCTERKFVSFCGHKKIGNEDQCCRDKKGITAVYRKQDKMKCCQREYYNTSTHYCYKNKIPLQWHQRQCGNRVYDDRLKKCCRKTLYDDVNEWDSTYQCCSSKIFNKFAEKCCQPQKFLIPEGKQCCHGSSYDVQKERCCRNGPLQFQKLSERCCGDQLYDTITRGCCDKNIFNPATHMCCKPGGDIIPVRSERKCCGPKSYNSKTEVCCNPNKSQIYTKKNRNHNRCCVDYTTGDVKTYSVISHYCRCGRIHSRKQHDCLSNHKRSKRKRKNSFKKGTCPVLRRTAKCMTSLNVCKRKALLAKVQGRRRHRRGELDVLVQKELYSNIAYKKRKLIVSGSCSVRRSKLIILTDKVILGKHFYLTDEDIIISWIGHFRRKIGHIRKNCIKKLGLCM